MTLTEKQASFVEQYLVDLNATQAAIRAGYSEKTANEQGARLLANVSVKQAIDERIAERSQRTQITQDRVLREYAKLAFFDPRKLFSKSGEPLPINELEDDTAAVIAGLDVHEEYAGSGADRTFVGYTKKYKLADKKGALDSLARHLGMFKDKVQVSGPNEGPVQTVSMTAIEYEGIARKLLGEI